jgi:hypothetical protein
MHYVDERITLDTSCIFFLLFSVPLLLFFNFFFYFYILNNVAPDLAHM